MNFSESEEEEADENVKVCDDVNIVNNESINVPVAQKKRKLQPSSSAIENCSAGTPQPAYMTTNHSSKPLTTTAKSALKSSSPPLVPLQIPTPKLKTARRVPKTKTNKNNKEQAEYSSYDDPDTETNDLSAFSPNRPSGNNLNNIHVTRNNLSKPIDFFELFFTDEITNSIVEHTNAYAYIQITKKVSYSTPQGSWKETNPAEIKNLLALMLYQGIVKASTTCRYWSTKSLYHGLWARNFMSRSRFQTLLSMLHVVDPLQEDPTQKLRKVDSFIDHFRNKSKELFQPFKNIAIDERLVKSKHRFGIRQYIQNKPAKFGLKLWVLADSKTGYSYDFYVYTSKTNEVFVHGLGYHVVIKLM